MWGGIRIKEFDTNGLKTNQTIYTTHTKFSSGEKKSVTSYTYNSKGDIVLEEVDNGVFYSSDHTPDGIPDDIIEYRYGNNGEIVEKIKEQVTLSSTRCDAVKYLHEVTDGDGDGIPEVTIVCVFWLDTVYYDTDIPPESLPDWYVNELTDLNNGNDDDGWGLNWDGHDTGTCSTCGNLLGQVNKILRNCLKA
ncbi:MAG: hypothetical protein ACMUIP_06015 [bacterium]